MSLARQKGYTLLNLLIYTTLSLLLLLASYQLLLHLARNAQHVQFRLVQAQNLSLARDLLQNTILNAHLSDCGNIASALTRMSLVKDASQQMVLTTPVQVYGADDAIARTWQLTAPGNGEKLPDSQILVIRSVSGGVKLQQRLESEAKQIMLPVTAIDWQPGDFVVLANCQRIVLDQIAAVYPSSRRIQVDLVKPMPFAMPVGSQLYHYDFAAYYLGKTADATPGLYRLDDRGERQALFADIVEFDWMVGMYKSTNHAWQYVAPEAVKNWQAPASLKLNLAAKLADDSIIKTEAVVLLQTHETK